MPENEEGFGCRMKPERASQKTSLSEHGDIQPWDSDHTALVHVLWSARRGGITISDADALASHIMRSKWMQAVKQHAKAGPFASRAADSDSKMGGST